MALLPEEPASPRASPPLPGRARVRQLHAGGLKEPFQGEERVELHGRGRGRRGTVTGEPLQEEA